MSFKSKSPVTGENYSYPKDSKDKSEINAFLDKNKSLGRKIVGVIGLGFVGAATATMISDTESDNYAVIGFDIENEGSFWKIADINSGKLPLNCGDDELSSAFSRSFSHNKILATGALDFLKNCDVIMVAINLDVSKEYSLSGEMNYEVLYKPYLDCIEGVGQRMDQNALLILESTLPVGFTEYSVLPIIKEQFEKRNLDNNQILLGHSYERVTPGKNYLNSMKNFYRVYSGINEASKIATRSFLKSIINTDIFELTELQSPRASEMGKLLENSYRSMNIAFMIEWSRFAESMSVNLYDVVDAIRKRPTHANMMYPGIGVGGYCLTKDGLIADASFTQGSLSMTVNAVKETDKMPNYALEFVHENIEDAEQCKKTDCLIAGVAYAPGVGDTRFSPVEPFYNHISKLFLNTYLVDPYLDFWEELGINVKANLNQINISSVKNIFICTKHPEFYDMLNSIPQETKRKINLFDLVGLYQNSNQNEQVLLFRNYFLLGSN